MSTWRTIVLGASLGLFVSALFSFLARYQYLRKKDAKVRQGRTAQQLKLFQEGYGKIQLGEQFRQRSVVFYTNMLVVTFMLAFFSAVATFLWEPFSGDNTSFSDFSKSIDKSFIFFGAAIGVGVALGFWFITSRSKLFYKKYAGNLAFWLFVAAGTFIGLGFYVDD